MPMTFASGTKITHIRYLFRCRVGGHWTKIDRCFFDWFLSLPAHHHQEGAAVAAIEG